MHSSRQHTRGGPGGGQTVHELRQEDQYRASRFRTAMDNDPGPQVDYERPEWVARTESMPERETVTLTRAWPAGQ